MAEKTTKKTACMLTVRGGYKDVPTGDVGHYESMGWVKSERPSAKERIQIARAIGDTTGADELQAKELADAQLLKIKIKK